MASSVALDRRAWTRVASLVRAVPAWAWLAGLVTVSALARYALARRMPAPWIMVDELIYSELAKSFAASGEFEIREHASSVYTFVYPILISPAYVLFDGVPDAYRAVKTINAVLMSLAAVPVYLLARRMLPPALSLLAAALALAVPSMVYTGTVMTENAFYPVFLTGVLALVRALERPTLVRLAMLLAVCGLAVVTRPQALALIPALVTAPLVLALFERRGLRALVPFSALYAAVGALGLAVAAVQLARGRALSELLGAYQVTSQHDYAVDEVVRWFLYHAAELDLYLGVVPFAAMLLLAVVAPRLPAPVRVFVAAAVSVSFWLVLEVGAFATMPGVGRIQERNMFYVAPLFLIALLVLVDRGLPRPPRAAGLAAAVAAALVGIVPYGGLINTSAVSDTLALLPLWNLGDAYPVAQAQTVAVLGGIVGAALFLLCPPRAALVLPLAVLVYFAVALQPIDERFRVASAGALFSGITTRADWVDANVPSGAEVAAIWTGNTDRFVINQNEFFNRSVGPVYYVRDPTPGGLPETNVAIDDETGVLRGPDGRPVRAEYVLVDGSITPGGKLIAFDERRGVGLFRVDGAVRSLTKVVGLYANDTWSGRTVTYTRRQCAGGRLKVTVQGDPALFPRGSQLVVARVRGGAVVRRAVTPGPPESFSVPLAARAGRCFVAFTVTPTAIPAVVTKGANPDPRVLGIHFSAFAYEPVGR